MSERDWPSERPQLVGLISTKPEAFKALFPNGLDVELRPIGPTQVAAAVALREHLDTQLAEAKVKAQVMDDFDKARCRISVGSLDALTFFVLIK